MVFGNIEKSEQIAMYEKAKILMHMQGEKSMCDQCSLEETAKYIGDGNPVVYSREFDLDLK